MSKLYDTGLLHVLVHACGLVHVTCHSPRMAARQLTGVTSLLLPCGLQESKSQSSDLAASTLFLRHVGSPFSIYYTKLTELKAFKSYVHKTTSKCSLLYDVLYLDF